MNAALWFALGVLATLASLALVDAFACLWRRHRPADDCCGFMRQFHADLKRPGFARLTLAVGRKQAPAYLAVKTIREQRVEDLCTSTPVREMFKAMKASLESETPS